VHALLHARVIRTQARAVAAAAAVAVEEVLSPSHTAYAALVAVELPPRDVVVVELALVAVISTKLDGASVALARNRLSGVAKEAHNLANVSADKLMLLLLVLLPLALELVVTVPAHERLLPAARCNERTPATVVLASVEHDSFRPPLRRNSAFFVVVHGSSSSGEK